MPTNRTSILTRELDKAANAITEVIIPLFIGIGKAGKDKALVASRVRRQATDGRLRAVLKVYEEKTGASSERLRVLRSYLLDE